MQGLADGYFVLPYTIGDYLSPEIQSPKVKTDTPEFDEAEKSVRDRIAKLLSIQGKDTVDELHKKLGHIMWENVGMAARRRASRRRSSRFRRFVRSFGPTSVFRVPTRSSIRSSRRRSGWPTSSNWAS